MRCVYLLLTVLYLFAAAIYAQQDYDIDKEIQRVRKDLASVTAQRKSVKEDIAKDEKEFTEYTDRTRKRFDALRNDLDSIQRAIQKQNLITDSLTAAVEGLNNSKKQVDMQQDLFRAHLIDGCDKYQTIISDFPPLIYRPMKASLSFLRSELSSKNIDNSEGIQRLYQVIKDIDEATGSILVVQGTSPIAEIRGTVYQIRIGAMFEAVVNTEGTSYAIWNGYGPDGKELWKTGSDQITGAQLLKCANVREGKSLPSFVELPLFSRQDNGAAQ